MMIWHLLVANNLVKGPHVDEMEELRKQLDGQSSVDSTFSQEAHSGLQDLQNAVGRCRRLVVRVNVVVTVIQ